MRISTGKRNPAKGLCSVHLPRFRRKSDAALLGLLLLVVMVGCILRGNILDRQSFESILQELKSNPPSSEAAQDEETNWIWEDLATDEDRAAAMDRVLPYLDRFIGILNQTQWDKWVSQERCNVTLVGSQWGAHQLCHYEKYPPPDCNFISFGISNDYSFDTELADNWKCRGFAADPTIVHKSSLHDRISFHNIAAKTLTIEKEQAREAEKTGKAPWWIVSMPTVKKFLGLKRVNILKMDCESCEYSLSKDIIQEDPQFFHSVDQFTFEVHLNRMWLRDTRHLYYYALLFKLLQEANLRVMGTSMGGCGDREKVRSIPEIYQMNYPGAGRQRLRERRSCHEYLFARY